MSRFLRDFWDFTIRERCRVLRVSHWQGGKVQTGDIVRAHPSQHVYSLAKVLTMTAVGLLVDEGRIAVQDPALALLLRALDGQGKGTGKTGADEPDVPAGLDSRWAQVRMEDLLGHRAGLAEGFLDIDQEDWRTWGTGDFLRYTLETPLRQAPGAERIYSDGAYYLLGRIVEEVSGQPLFQFLRERLLDPMGVRDAAWETCPLGHAMGATGLFIRTEDMCKIGVLYHQEGMYEGRRCLSAEWVRTVREREWELSRVHPNGAYGKGGMMGQMLLIVPHADRVVAWQAYDRKGNDRLVRFVAEYPA